MALVADLGGKTAAVMGLGRSGWATAHALIDAGCTVLAWDDKEEARASAEREGFTLTDLARVDWQGVDLLVWSPGIPHSFPTPHPVAEKARKAGVPLVCDIELLCRGQSGARFVAITGTNGKSTTTTLIGHILAGGAGPVAVGGNLGNAALSLPDLGLDGTYVLELSSYQLELLDTARFDVAVLLNITPDHLARHGGMERYVQAKASIFDRLRPGGTAIVGADDDECRKIADKLGRRNDITLIRISGADGIAGLRSIASLPGQHNWQNASAAIAAARACGMADETILARLATYPGLQHRQELVAIIDGVRYVNDSKATNADAAAKAIACYDRIYWIAGGQAKEGGIASLRPLFPRIRKAFLIGEAAQSFAATLEGKVACDLSLILDNAVTRAHDAALEDGGQGAVVLLSPACASWDQFKSFEHRGDEFRRLVEALQGERSAA